MDTKNFIYTELPRVGKHFNSKISLGIKLCFSPSEIFYSYLAFCLWKKTLKLIKNIKNFKMWTLLWQLSNTFVFALYIIYSSIHVSYNLETEMDLLSFLKSNVY